MATGKIPSTPLFHNVPKGSPNKPKIRQNKRLYLAEKCLIIYKYFNVFATKYFSLTAVFYFCLIKFSVVINFFRQ